MTDPQPPAAAAPGPRPRRLRAVGFVAVCLLVVLLVVVLVAAGLYFFAPRSAPPGVTMADLHGVADLRARFNADRGQVRLVAIFSPT
jgi:hypothetical protein